jgi:hypothetical protein
MLTQKPGSVYQIAYIVEDLEESANQWAKMTGAGPFFLFDHFQFINPLHNGRSVDLDVSIALGFSAGLCVELIKQHDERPSIYYDWWVEKGYGLHHVAMLAADYPAVISSRNASGIPTAFSAAFGEGTRLAYLDTRQSLGCYLEIIELTEFVKGALASIRVDHENWDGADVLRPFPA